MSAFYSMLEPVANILQEVNLDLLTVKNQIITIIEIFQENRQSADENFNNPGIKWKVV